MLIELVHFYLSDLPHFAFPLAACQGVMPRAHETKNSSNTAMQANEISFFINVRLVIFLVG